MKRIPPIKADQILNNYFKNYLSKYNDLKLENIASCRIKEALNEAYISGYNSRKVNYHLDCPNC